MKPVTQPKIAVELPNKVIPSPISLDVSKKIPPMKVAINPVPIKYSGFSFNNFFINYDCLFVFFILIKVLNIVWEKLTNEYFNYSNSYNIY